MSDRTFPAPVFGAPAPEQHAVLMVVKYDRPSYGKVRVLTEDFIVHTGSWNEAIAIHEGLENDRREGKFDGYLGPQVAFFCVRAMDDPRSKLAFRGDKTLNRGPAVRDVLSKVGSRALGYSRKYSRDAVGKIAREAVADESLMTIREVLSRVAIECNRLGVDASSYTREDAVFSRITIGRVSTGYRYGDRGHAYFIRKKDGPLHKVTVNGARLNQTTRLYRGSFIRLVKQDDGSFVRASDLVTA